MFLLISNFLSFGFETYNLLYERLHVKYALLSKLFIEIFTIIPNHRIKVAKSNKITFSYVCRGQEEIIYVFHVVPYCITFFFRSRRDRSRSPERRERKSPERRRSESREKRSVSKDRRSRSKSKDRWELFHAMKIVTFKKIQLGFGLFCMLYI